jgi:hypothetical protein
VNREVRLRNAADAAAGFVLDPPEVSDLCVHAELFMAWSGDLVQAAIDREDPVAINQAKIFLVDRYFGWLDSIPKRHRSLTGRYGHVCVAHVFEGMYRRLRAVELDLRPPPLAIAPPPPPQIIREEPRRRLDGMLIGDIDDDEFR